MTKPFELRLTNGELQALLAAIAAYQLNDQHKKWLITVKAKLLADLDTRL